MATEAERVHDAARAVRRLYRNHPAALTGQGINAANLHALTLLLERADRGVARSEPITVIGVVR